MKFTSIRPHFLKNQRAEAPLLSLFLILFAGVSLLATGEPVYDLDELLAQAGKESEEIRSLGMSLEALGAEIRARDIDIAPSLTANLLQTQDQRATFNPGRRSLSRELNLGVLQPFSTGTTVGLTAGYELASVANVGSRNLATWQFTVSQSLWRNFFGHATRVRREVDEAEKKRRQFELLLRRQQLLTRIETAYWDLALAAREMEIRQENLVRSEQMQKWIGERIRHSAAEKSDGVQVRALVTTRQMELLDTKNTIEAAWNRLRQELPTIKMAAWKPRLESLETDRNPASLLAVDDGIAATPKRIDALVSRYRGKETRALADRERDALRPQLDFVLSYGRNGIESTFSNAWQQAFSNNSTYTQFGLQFAMQLGSDVRDGRLRAAELQADALELDAKRLGQASDIGWEDLNERIRFQRQNIENSRKLAALQIQKTEEERKRYEQGRSTAFQTISFEIEAAQAKLEVYRQLAALRRIESLSRQFTREKESLP
jgi:outer membrane protein TolC